MYSRFTFTDIGRPALPHWNQTEHIKYLQEQGAADAYLLLLEAFVSLSAAVSAGDTSKMAAECQPWIVKPIAEQREQVTEQWRSLISLKEQRGLQNLRTNECAINYSLQNSSSVSDRFGMCLISHTHARRVHTPQGFFFYHQQIDIGLGDSLLRNLN